MVSVLGVLVCKYSIPSDVSAMTYTEHTSEDWISYLQHYRELVVWSRFIFLYVITTARRVGSEADSYTRVGFMSFTTTGYGVPAPVTPAGRSVFVVWALMGVATMTILISGQLSFDASWTK